MKKFIISLCVLMSTLSFTLCPEGYDQFYTPSEHERKLVRQEYDHEREQLERLVAQDVDETTLYAILRLLAIELQIVDRLLHAETGLKVNELLIQRKRQLEVSSQAAAHLYKAVMQFATNDILLTGKNGTSKLGSTLRESEKRIYLRRMKKVLIEYRDDFLDKQHDTLKRTLDRSSQQYTPYFVQEPCPVNTDMTQQLGFVQAPASQNVFSKPQEPFASSGASAAHKDQQSLDLRFSNLWKDFVAHLDKHDSVTLIDEVLMLARYEIQTHVSSLSERNKMLHGGKPNDGATKIDVVDLIPQVCPRARALFGIIREAATENTMKLGSWNPDVYEGYLDKYVQRLESSKANPHQVPNLFQQDLCKNGTTLCDSMKRLVERIFVNNVRPVQSQSPINFAVESEKVVASAKVEIKNNTLMPGHVDVVEVEHVQSASNAAVVPAQTIEVVSTKVIEVQPKKDSWFVSALAFVRRGAGIVGEDIVTAYHITKDTLRQVGSSLYAAGTSATGVVSDWSTGALASVKRGAGIVSEDIVTAYHITKDTLRQVGSSLYAAGSSATGAVSDWSARALASVKRGAGSVGEGIVSAYHTTKDTLRQVGSSLYAAGSSATGAVSDWSARALASVKRGAGIMGGSIVTAYHTAHDKLVQTPFVVYMKVTLAAVEVGDWSARALVSVKRGVGIVSEGVVSAYHTTKDTLGQAGSSFYAAGTSATGAVSDWFVHALASVKRGAETIGEGVVTAYHTTKDSLGQAGSSLYAAGTLATGAVSDWFVHALASVKRGAGIVSEGVVSAYHTTKDTLGQAGSSFYAAGTSATGVVSDWFVSALASVKRGAGIIGEGVVTAYHTTKDTLGQVGSSFYAAGTSATGVVSDWSARALASVKRGVGIVSEGVVSAYHATKDTLAHAGSSISAAMTSATGAVGDWSVGALASVKQGAGIVSEGIVSAYHATKDTLAQAGSSLYAAGTSATGAVGDWSAGAVASVKRGAGIVREGIVSAYHATKDTLAQAGSSLYAAGTSATGAVGDWSVGALASVKRGVGIVSEGIVTAYHTTKDTLAQAGSSFYAAGTSATGVVSDWSAGAVALVKRGAGIVSEGIVTAYHTTKDTLAQAGLSLYTAGTSATGAVSDWSAHVLASVKRGVGIVSEGVISAYHTTKDTLGQAGSSLYAAGSSATGAVSDWSVHALASVRRGTEIVSEGIVTAYHTTKDTLAQVGLSFYAAGTSATGAVSDWSAGAVALVKRGAGIVSEGIVTAYHTTKDTLGQAGSSLYAAGTSATGAVSDWSARALASVKRGAGVVGEGIVSAYHATKDTLGQAGSSLYTAGTSATGAVSDWSVRALVSVKRGAEIVGENVVSAYHTMKDKLV